MSSLNYSTNFKEITRGFLILGADGCHGQVQLTKKMLLPPFNHCMRQKYIQSRQFPFTEFIPQYSECNFAGNFDLISRTHPLNRAGKSRLIASLPPTEYPGTRINLLTVISPCLFTLCILFSFSTPARPSEDLFYRPTLVGCHTTRFDISSVFPSSTVTG